MIHLFGMKPRRNSVQLGRYGRHLDEQPLIRNLGVEPVVYDEEQVLVSMDNMASHMEYIGWYGSNVRSQVEYRDHKAYVTYYVRLGHRYTIPSIRFEVPDSEEFKSDFELDPSGGRP